MNARSLGHSEHIYEFGSGTSRYLKLKIYMEAFRVYQPGADPFTPYRKPTSQRNSEGKMLQPGPGKIAT